MMICVDGLENHCGTIIRPAQLTQNLSIVCDWICIFASSDVCQVEFRPEETLHETPEPQGVNSRPDIGGSIL